jgi:hypothetical protein
VLFNFINDRSLGEVKSLLDLMWFMPHPHFNWVLERFLEVK